MTPSDVPEGRKPCCVASRTGFGQDEGDLSAVGSRAAQAVSTGKRATSGMVHLEGGEFLMGTEDPIGFPADGEGPVRAVVLRPFWIEPVAVSNERFAAFVDATGHTTDAERYGWSFVFGGLLPDDFPPPRARWLRHRGGVRSSVQTGVIRRERTLPSRIA